MELDKNRGVVTVEACFVVPIFLFFMLSLANLFMILMAEAHIHQSLAEASDYVAEYSYFEYKTGKTEIIDKILLNTQFKKYLGDDFYVEHTVKNNKNGILITADNDRDNPKIFHASAIYIAGIDLPLFGKFYITLKDEIKQKRFLGYGPEEKSHTYVYVTPEQSVYHVSRGCTHLSLQYGSKSSKEKDKYTPCRFCGEGDNDAGKIYVSRTTNVYHCEKTCSGLKRTVKRVKKEEAAGLLPCSRCGGNE